MRRLFRMMSEQVQVTAQQLPTWWANLAPDPRTWAPFTWVLAGIALVILLALLIRPRRRAGPRRPELLISHGELRVAAGAAPRVASALLAPDSAAYELVMTVSNLSASPVQLLELAVRTNRARSSTTAEVTAVLPPHGAVDVSAELSEAGGDEGVLDLFVYVPDMPPKTFRVRARLRWEPWNSRYRVLPLDQRVDVARGVGERTQRRRRASTWRREAGPAGAGASASWPARPPGSPAYSEEGRFEPRPEFARPRTAPAQGPQAGTTRSGPRHPPAPPGSTPAHEGASAGGAPPSGDEAGDGRGGPVGEETWPPARPARETHRARVAQPDPHRRPDDDDIDPSPSERPKARAARPPAEALLGVLPDDVGDERSRTKPPDDADRAAERGAGPVGDRARERTRLGRAARAARGTERDGPSVAGDSEDRPRRQGAGTAAERSRRWLAGSRRPERPPDPGRDEPAGSDEVASEKERKAGAREGGHGGGGTSGRRGAVGRAEGRAEGRDNDRPEDHADERNDDEGGQKRPRLEFPDEF